MNVLVRVQLTAVVTTAVTSLMLLNLIWAHSSLESFGILVLLAAAVVAAAAEVVHTYHIVLLVKRERIIFQSSSKIVNNIPGLWPTST
jgi:hypothetical protein